MLVCPVIIFFEIHDCYFIREFKKAVKEDIQNSQPEPVYQPLPPLPPEESDLSWFPSLVRPKVTSIAKAERIARARGITDFKAVRESDTVVLHINWTEEEFEAFYKAGNKITGCFSDEGYFIARRLHRM